MKRLLTLLTTLGVAFSIAMPVFAQKNEPGKAHAMHAKNTKSHGKKHGKKKGQQGTNPGQKEGQETTKPAEPTK